MLKKPASDVFYDGNILHVPQLFAGTLLLSIYSQRWPILSVFGVSLLTVLSNQHSPWAPNNRSSNSEARKEWRSQLKKSARAQRAKAEVLLLSGGSWMYTVLHCRNNIYILTLWRFECKYWVYYVYTSLEWLPRVIDVVLHRIKAQDSTWKMSSLLCERVTYQSAITSDYLKNTYKWLHSVNK